MARNVFYSFHYQKYVDKAVDRQDNIDEYDICKEV